MPGVSLADQASLIIAALGLNLVRLLRGAIQAADEQAAARAPTTLTPAAIYEPREVIRSQPIVVPAEHIYSRPIIEPRPAIAAENASIPAESTSTPGVGSEHPCRHAPDRQTPDPIQPPWAVLPWQEPPKQQVRVKVVRYRTDIVNKGSLIDSFI